MLFLSMDVLFYMTGYQHYTTLCAKPDNENFNPYKMYSENECCVRGSTINREMKSR
jgi:hypothetical protein